MKGAVIYSSKTGNTRKVAQAIMEGLNDDFELKSVDENPDPGDYDFIFMGYWVDKGTADANAIEFMKRIVDKRVALFSTLGAYPDSDHARDSQKRGEACLGENCRVVDSFICQGAIDPELIEWMKTLPADHPHAPNEERINRWKSASSRPNEDDLENAREFGRRVLEKI